MKWNAILLMIVAVLVAFGAFVLSKQQRTPATPAKNILSDIKTERMQVEVVTFKPEAKKRMRLPELIQADPAKHVTAATRINPIEDQPVEVTAVLDERTGETTLFEREIERPWIGFNKHTEAGVFLGINELGEQEIRLHARHEFAQVKALRIGLMGSADLTQAGISHFVGIGVWGKW